MTKNKQNDFAKLCDLKAEMKSFLGVKETLKRKLDLAVNDQQYKEVKEELNKHLLSFKELEAALVQEEKKMYNIERGLYKGVAINVKDKTQTKFPLYLEFSNINNHVGYIGTTRVGKTKNMLSDADQLIKAGWDVIMIDPKGGAGQEILTEVIQSTLEAGRPEDFKYLSPAFPIESEYVNLLYGMSDEEAASLIRTFAEAVSDDAFFTGVVFENTLAALKALSFIQAATDPFNEYTKMLEEKEMEKYLFIKNVKDGEHKMLIDRWNRVTKPNELHLSIKKSKKLEKFEYKIPDPSASLYLNRSMVTFKILSHFTTYEAFDEIRKQIKSFVTTPPVEKIGIELYTKIENLRYEALSILDKVLSTDKTNFSKIAKTHSVLLSQLVYDKIGRVFSDIGINPLLNRLLSDERGLVCVVQPYPMKFKTISNITVMALLKTIESMMGLVGASGRANKRRLAIMIDEAGAVAYKGMEDLLNKAGGLGVTMFLYTQTKEDYALRLGETNADVIMDNVNTPIYMRMNNDKSCKRVAESLGTIRKQVSMYMSSTSGAGRFSVGNEDVPIAEAKDITELKIGSGFLRHNGELFYLDFPYMKGIENSPIKMPMLDSEEQMRYLSKYELSVANLLEQQD